MVRKKATTRRGQTKAVTTKADTEIATWEEQMKRDADIAADMEAGLSSAQFFSTQGGVLKFNDVEIPDNQMAVIIVDYCLEKAYYSGDYDPDNPVPPDCYSFSRGDEREMVPHEQSEERQNEQCDGCEWNEFGTAERGKGKACKDGRRLGLLPAGNPLENGEWNILDDPAWYKEEELAILRVPPTSLKAWAKYVKQLKGALSRPPYGVVTLIKVTPDPKKQFTIGFHVICNLPDSIGEVIMERHRQALEPDVIDFPYQSLSDRDAEPESKPARGRRTAKKTASKKTASKKTAARRTRKY